MKPPVELVCSFGVLWIDHFQPPVGSGRGCLMCATGQQPLFPRTE